MTQTLSNIIHNDLILAAADDGHAEIKVYLSDKTKIRIPSRARAGDGGISSIGSASGGVLDGNYVTENQKFSVGEKIDGEGTRFDGYPFSALNRVIVHHALRKAGLGGKRVKLATGLPVSHYFSGANSSPNLALIERKKKNLLIPVRAASGIACAEIVANQVFAEGVAAWVDYCVDDDGKIVEDFSAPAAIVDIGGRTTDCVTVLPGAKVDHKRSGTANIGVLNLMESVAAKIAANFDLVTLELHLLDKSLQTGKVTLWNKEHDISDIINEVKAEISDQILREVSRRIGRGHEFEKVLFVGGGAKIFTAVQDAFPNAAVPEDPEFANAKGMLKYMQHV